MAGPLPVNLLCGYLGAGKTTLLNRLLAQGSERILVMVNDFGDIAVDAALIAGRSADTIQLSNGCICCSMAGGPFQAFEQALALRDRVDRLVIEASGVAEPRRLASFALAERDLDCRAVVTVVDPQSLAGRLADPRVGKVVESQIRGADAVYLSRAGISGRALRRQAARRVARLNPLAGLHLAPDADFLAALTARHDSRSLSALSPDLSPDRAHDRLFATRTIDLGPAPDRDHLTATVNRHASAVHRMKGFVRFPAAAGTHLLQLAGGVLSLTPISAPEDIAVNRLVAIAPDAGALQRLAGDLGPTGG